MNSSTSTPARLVDSTPGTTATSSSSPAEQLHPFLYVIRGPSHESTAALAWRYQSRSPGLILRTDLELKLQSLFATERSVIQGRRSFPARELAWVAQGPPGSSRDQRAPPPTIEAHADERTCTANSTRESGSCQLTVVVRMAIHASSSQENPASQLALSAHDSVASRAGHDRTYPQA